MKCVDVTFEMGDGSYEADTPWYEAEVGDLIWNTKDGGHVLVRRASCGDHIPEGERHAGAMYDCGCGGYPLTNHDKDEVLICECGEDDSWRDHHYFLLARRSS